MSVAPRTKLHPTTDTLERLRTAAGKRERADTKAAEAQAELRAAVIAASEAGGSIRVIADIGNLSTATVRKYVQEHRATQA